MAALLWAAAPAEAVAFGESVQHWAREFPKTDFTRRAVDFSEIRSVGATRNSIPPIVKPAFQPVGNVEGIGEHEPVLAVTLDFAARAYPIRVLLWHEVVNDTLSGKPIVVTYSPLSNSGAAYFRTLEGKEMLFGNTGRLRHFNTILYDRESGSWWQQFTGKGIVGARVGKGLTRIASVVQSWERFREAHPESEVLMPPNPTARPYGTTPFVGMDKAGPKGLDAYLLPPEVKPFERVVVIGETAWTIKRLREKGAVEKDGFYLGVVPGQNSTHDTKWISFGRDVGNVIARHRDPTTGDWVTNLHTIAYAFAFKAFYPGGILYTW
ncbi:MAG: DUF3179 domain-containing (seleno)protein [Rhodospirillaceae bacterium]